jgi:hypothetical protein
MEPPNYLPPPTQLESTQQQGVKSCQGWAQGAQAWGAGEGQCSSWGTTHLSEVLSFLGFQEMQQEAEVLGVCLCQAL